MLGFEALGQAPLGGFPLGAGLGPVAAHTCITPPHSHTCITPPRSCTTVGTQEGTMLGTAPSFPRGTTIPFATTFYDQFGAVIQPAAAVVEIDYPDASGAPQTIQVAMAPGVGVTWAALWDSRGAGPGSVSWSIHTAAPIPVSVEDGFFILTANPANLVTF